MVKVKYDKSNGVYFVFVDNKPVQYLTKEESIPVIKVLTELQINGVIELEVWH